MRKAVLAILILTISLMCTFAETYDLELKYKIKREVEYKTETYFGVEAGKPISSFEVNTEDTASQVSFFIATNNDSAFDLNFDFTPLSYVASDGTTYYGLYDATINGAYLFGKENTTSTKTVTLGSNLKSVSTTCVGPKASSADSEAEGVYSFSFDFAKYINDYAAGTYQGQIKVEIVQK